MATRITYCDDSRPGITRKKVRNGWAYYTPGGDRITDRDEIDRLNAVGLPPAYRDAWYCPKRNGHIQAVGWDEKGRKQYRYHNDFREAQEAAKYEKCADFGHALPRLRKRVEADLASHGLHKDRAIAAVVRLLDIGHIRVGNEAYAEADLSLKAMLEPVVERLGNTPAIARKSYVHPALIALVKQGQSSFRKALRLPRSARYLSRAERGLIAFLEAGTPASLPDMKAAA